MDAIVIDKVQERPKLLYVFGLYKGLQCFICRLDTVSVDLVSNEDHFRLQKTTFDSFQYLLQMCQMFPNLFCPHGHTHTLTQTAHTGS